MNLNEFERIRSNSNKFKWIRTSLKKLYITYLQTVDFSNGCPVLATYCLAKTEQFFPLLIFANNFGLFNGTTSWSNAFATSVTVEESKQDLIGVTQRNSNSLTSLQKSAPCNNFCWIFLGSEKEKETLYSKSSNSVDANSAVSL